jgi:hypothetical protein
MTQHRSIGAAMAAALSLAIASPGQAGPLDDVRVEPLWLAPPSARAVPQRGSHPSPALLILPRSWGLDDAAAVLVVDGPEGAEERQRVVVALVEEGTAVLVLDPHPPRGRATAGAPAASTPREMVPELLGALHALRRDAGAGAVVALGHGAGGQAVLMAAREEVAAPLLGRDGPRFAAAAALGPGRPAFATGAPLPAREAWPTRAPLLCAALGAAMAPGAEQDCVAALLSPAVESPEVAALTSGQPRH